jgi:hypothetical protein
MKALMILGLVLGWVFIIAPFSWIEKAWRALFGKQE